MISELVSVIAVILTAGTTIASVAWLASKLNASVLTLSHSIEHLAKVVDKLDDKVDNHSERLATLEATNKNK